MSVIGFFFVAILVILAAFIWHFRQLPSEEEMLKRNKEAFERWLDIQNK